MNTRGGDNSGSFAALMRVDATLGDKPCRPPPAGAFRASAWMRHDLHGVVLGQPPLARAPVDATPALCVQGIREHKLPFARARVDATARPHFTVWRPPCVPWRECAWMRLATDARHTARICRPPRAGARGCDNRRPPRTWMRQAEADAVRE